jgi:PKD repeat protein
VTITVTPATGGNQPPVAVISADPTSGPAPLVVVFSSAGSFDPDGTIVDYFWAFSNGRTTNRENPRLRFNSDGTYTATLTVTDDQGATATDTILIVVGDAPVNQPPTAVATADVTSGDAPLAVNFTGSGSSDSDGTIASYAWAFGDGATSSAANPSHSYTAAGTYLATLTVTDNGGATDSASVTITVTDPTVNQPPTAVATADVTNGEAPLMVFFNGSGSSDADGMLISYAWEFGDGNSTTGATAFNTYTVAGTYVATLTVTDNEGATATDSITITVTEPAANQPPTAVANADVTSGTAPVAVNFTGSGSSDSDGTIASYAWAFGDGATSNTTNPSHSYTAAGTYVATLTVTDNEGATATDSVTIIVTEPGTGCTSNCAIVSDISLVVRGNGSLVALVTVVDENGSTLSGATVDVIWTLPDGTTMTATATVSGRGTARFNLSDFGPGSYLLAITDVSLTGYTFDVDNSVLSGTVVK